MRMLDCANVGVIGITVGAVVIPQSMAYAKLAQLPPEYGLYSSFMGVLIYWFFATSKDITIGVSTRDSILDVFILTFHSLLLYFLHLLVTSSFGFKSNIRNMIDPSLPQPCRLSPAP